MSDSLIVDVSGQPLSYGGGQGSTYYVNDGEKYDGGLGPVPIIFTDYWALRQRSATFFKTNLYARGIIRRLVTNVINTGLALETDPIVSLIPLTEDNAAEWSISVEDEFHSWGSLADVCDWSKTDTFGEIERNVYREALIEGDVLVIEHHNKNTQLPSYEIISGSLVTSPLDQTVLSNDHIIEWGVELNSRREQVAYHVIQADFTHKRIPAKGRNGRRISWLYYGTDKRHDEVRGEPLLSIIMQSVSEIDKYRDSTQRKASVNALLAMFFYQSTDGKSPNSRPVSAAATRRISGSAALSDGSEYKYNMASSTPGIIYEFLPPGLEPKGFNADGTDEKFGEFEDAIVSGIAWGLEMPKSVLKMEFSNSYSASRGEIKEFNMFLGAARNRYADTFTRPIYRSWMVSMVLTRRISAPNMLEAWRNPMRFAEFAAWTNSNWFGAVKEAVDITKEVMGQVAMADNGYTTNSVASRQLSGTRFYSNIKRVERENKLKADAMRPVLELEKEFGPEVVQAMTSRQDLRLVSNSGENINA